MFVGENQPTGLIKDDKTHVHPSNTVYTYHVHNRVGFWWYLCKCLWIWFYSPLLQTQCCGWKKNLRYFFGFDRGKMSHIGLTAAFWYVHWNGKAALCRRSWSDITTQNIKEVPFSTKRVHLHLLRKKSFLSSEELDHQRVLFNKE